MDSAELLEAFEELPPELRPPLMKIVRVLQDTVKREDFLLLRQTVADLAEAQRKTEERLDQLAQRMDQLTQRVDQLAQRMDELTQRVDQLTQRVDQLTQRMDELTQRVDQLAQRMDQLAEAQMKTEKALAKLIEDHSETRRRLESMSDAVGYELENKSFKSLPELLKRDMGVQVEERLLRKYILGPDGKRYIQLNIYGWGKRDGDKVLILGEAKTNLSKREIDRFLRLVRLVSSLEGVGEGRIVTVAVVHTITPDVQEYAKEKGIKVYWSYDL